MLTRKQKYALEYLRSLDEPVILLDYYFAGHSLKTLVSLVKHGLANWTSTFRLPTNVTPQEYEEARDTTSFVSAVK